MSRRLKPIKDLSVLVLAQRKHDRQLWAELLKNCGINHPLSMSEIEQAATTVGSGQVDVVFVDEAYGPKGIASVLIPARNVEFAGGRGICLVLCSKRATAQDVINARKLGFASLVILPASTDTVRKHLELAARYIPKTDEELGWSAPKIMAKREQEGAPLPAPKDDPQSAASQTSGAKGIDSGPPKGSPSNGQATQELAKDLDTWEADLADDQRLGTQTLPNAEVPASNAPQDTKQPDAEKTTKSKQASSGEEEGLAAVKITGRSGKSADQEMVFL